MAADPVRKVLKEAADGSDVLAPVLAVKVGDEVLLLVQKKLIEVINRNFRVLDCVSSDALVLAAGCVGSVLILI